MLVKATYSGGTIRFQKPLRFKHKEFEVMVEIPEKELEEMAEANDQMELLERNSAQSAGSDFLARIKKILGPDFKPRPHATVAQDKHAYVDALEEKYNR